MYEKKTNKFVEFSPIFPTAKGADAVFNLKFGLTKQVDQYISIGASIGVSESSKFGTPSMPVLLRGHLEGKGEVFSPFFNLDAGYNVNFEDFGHGSVIVNPSVGIAYKGITFAIGYYAGIATYSLPNGVSNISNAVNLTLGYRFGSGGGTSSFFKSMRFYANMGAAFALDEYSEVIVGPSVNVALMGKLSDNFTLGPTIGFTMWWDSRAEFFEDKLLSYALRGRYDFNQVRIGSRIHPYLQMDLGGATDLNDENSKTIFYYAPSVGLSLDVRGGRNCIDLGITYAPTVLEGSSYLSLETKSSLRLGLGYRF